MFLSPRAQSALTAFLLFLAALAAYANSFHGAFVYDDVDSILQNPSIRRLWPVERPFSPPSGGYTVSGRPLLNLSFALNYAAGRYAPAGYHAVNFVGHILAAWLLFGIVRRSLLRTSFASRALPLAFGAALLWTVHPLQTESVTYIVQRAESLGGLFYLLALYCFIRGGEEGRLWNVAAVGAALLGAGVKETIATLPLMAVFYDRAFVFPSFGAALRRRWPHYLGLVLVWIPLFCLTLANPGRGMTAGFNAQGYGWTYALFQPRVIFHYLWEAAWPAHLSFDDALSVSGPLLLASLLAFGILLAGVAVLFRRRPDLGFWGVWFLLVLAPSSSFIAILTETSAEHRLYLALAGLFVLAVLALDWSVGRRTGLFLALIMAWAAWLSWLTHQRNALYRSETVFWSHAVSETPSNRRAWMSLGRSYYEEGRLTEALAIFERPDALPPYNLMMQGEILGRLGFPAEAAKRFQAALALQQPKSELYYRYGCFLLRQGQVAAAAPLLQASLSMRPDRASAWAALGEAQILSGQAAAGRASFSKALELDPDNAALRADIGKCLKGSPSP